jgi:hypothetical protein
MVILIWILFVPLALYGLAVANPRRAKAVVAELKRRWRLRLIQKGGEKEAEDLFREFQARMLAEGFDEELIEEVFEEHRAEVVDRLGRRVANASLGKPTPLERNH